MIVATLAGAARAGRAGAIVAAVVIGAAAGAGTPGVVVAAIVIAA